ncbi:MAG: hypothetical protein KGJ49_05910 [Alphaproteobacteria bacterium]|nr:hypothetical protein [Alphaproteobacteria bacterium]
MAETRKAGGALLDGAERFDRLARIVKDNQLGRTSTGPRPPVTEAFELSPEDAWSRKYMTQCIGPVCFDPAVEPPVFAKFAAPVEAAANSGPIGLVIGKPVRRRSWLGRLFGR